MIPPIQMICFYSIFSKERELKLIMSNNAKPFTLFGFGGEHLKTKSISSEYYRGKRENDFHFCPERMILDFKILFNINGL